MVDNLRLANSPQACHQFGSLLDGFRPIVIGGARRAWRSRAASGADNRRAGFSKAGSDASARASGGACHEGYAAFQGLVSACACHFVCPFPTDPTTNMAPKQDARKVGFGSVVSTPRSVVDARPLSERFHDGNRSWHRHCSERIRISATLQQSRATTPRRGGGLHMAIAPPST
jgi:hypothetical protein